MFTWLLPDTQGDQVREKAIVVFCLLELLVGVYSLVKWRAFDVGELQLTALAEVAEMVQRSAEELSRATQYASSS